MTSYRDIAAEPATSDQRPATRVAALLLAAGESARMGTPKPLLPWGDTTLIEYQVRKLTAVGCRPIVVVLGHAAGEVWPRVPSGTRVVLNEAYRHGRASSLRAGTRALPDDTETVLILNVDQPRPRDVLRALLDAHRVGGAVITLPTHDGKRGHPVVLAGSLLAELRAVSDRTLGLRGVLEAHAEAICEVEFASPIVLLDINTPQEYEQAQVEYEGASHQT